MRQTPISFNCGELTLSGYIYYPDIAGKCPVVILCHPHPLYGGSMNNNVIREIGKILTTNNIVAMLFNFRGVGKSMGQYGNGIAEQDDVRASLDWINIQPQIDTDRIGLCGYSFGGGIAAIVGCWDDRIKALALVSPALDDSHLKYLKTCSKPKLFIIGENDDMISVKDIRQIYHNSSEPKEYNPIPNADHFLSGYEKVVAYNVANFFKDKFLNPAKSELLLL